MSPAAVATAACKHNVSTRLTSTHQEPRGREALTKSVQQNVSGADGEKFWRKMRHVPKVSVSARFGLTVNVAVGGGRACPNQRGPGMTLWNRTIAELTDGLVEDSDRVEDRVAIVARRREGAAGPAHLRTFVEC